MLNSICFNEIFAIHRTQHWTLLRPCLHCSSLEAHSIIIEVYMNNRFKCLSVEQRPLNIVMEQNKWGVSNLAHSTCSSPFCPLLQCFLDHNRSYTNNFSLCARHCAQCTYLHYLLIPTTNPELPSGVLTWWNRSKERFNSFKSRIYQTVHTWIP